MQILTIRFLRFCLSNVQTKALCLKTDVEHNRAVPINFVSPHTASLKKKKSQIIDEANIMGAKLV